MSMLPLILALLMPVQLESGRFTVSVDGSRIGTEDFTISKRGDGFLARGRIRYEINGETVDAESRMELDADLNPVSYEYRSADRVIQVIVGELLTEVEYTLEGQRTPYDIRFPDGGMIIDDNFFHHYLLLMYRENLGRAGVPVFVPQQMTLGTVDIREVEEELEERTFELDSNNLRLRATLDENGRMLRLVLVDSNVVVER